MTKYLMVVTTTPNKNYAQKISRVLVKKSLAACCQIVGPIESHYVWDNRVEVSKEYLCLIKTIKARYKESEKAIKKIHPYEIPEIIAIDISNGHKPYLNWIGTSVK